MRTALTLSTLISLSFILSAQGNYLLKADGVTDTYELIAKAGYFAETTGGISPDEFMNHGAYRHISQVYDKTLEEYVFAFDIHVDYEENGMFVTDGNKSELIDRQRNEIKCMDNVAATVAKDGETITYRWKFKLPEGMRTSSEFCHIHQIKGMGAGEEVAHPVFTLTCRSTSSKQVLQVINVPYEGSSNVNLAQTDLAPLLGEWIEAYETITVGRHGSYHLNLKYADTGHDILTVDKSDIMIWRETSDESTMRAKWGIYRSLGSNLSLKNQLRNERVLFADFDSIKDMSSLDETSDFLDYSEFDFYDLMGRKVKNPDKGIYIRNGKKTIIH